jgi:hypothetical protein
VFVEQNMSQKLKFHQKEGVNFIYCFLQPRSLLDWKKEMQLSQTMEFLKGETVARVTPEKYEGVQQWFQPQTEDSLEEKFCSNFTTKAC